jgi:hypothetical protein
VTLPTRQPLSDPPSTQDPPLPRSIHLPVPHDDPRSSHRRPGLAGSGLVSPCGRACRAPKRKRAGNFLLPIATRQKPAIDPSQRMKRRDKSIAGKNHSTVFITPFPVPGTHIPNPPNPTPPGLQICTPLRRPPDRTDRGPGRITPPSVHPEVSSRSGARSATSFTRTAPIRAVFP